jgi:molybdate transport system ATP-binding protein
MAYDPEILLLDEAFSALDDHLRTHMMKETLEYLKEFQGSTLCVTHNMEEAYRLCEKIAIIKTGSIETFGLKEEIFQIPLSLETAKITGCKNLAPAQYKEKNIIEVPQWGIELVTSKDVNKEVNFVGIRANYIKLAGEDDKENCFPVWIADESEAPFRTTLYLKIGSSASRKDDYHLQWEISKSQRELLRNEKLPLKVYLNPANVLLLTN